MYKLLTGKTLNDQCNINKYDVFKIISKKICINILLLLFPLFNLSIIYVALSHNMNKTKDSINYQNYLQKINCISFVLIMATYFN